MADWDPTNPDDNDIVSQYPSNERAARAAVVANFGVDHHEENDADVGKHEVIQILDNAGNPTIASGQIGIWNDAGVLKTRVGGGAVNQLARVSDVSGAAFPSGTRMLFHQATPPAGWTKATNVNDRVLRVVSGTTGGDTGGTWTISGLTVQNHTLTISQIPSHNHGGGGNTSSDTHSHSGTANPNGAHTHTVNRRSGGGSRPGAWHEGNDAGAFNTGSAGAHTHSLSINNDTHNHTYTIPNQGGGNAHSHGITHNGGWRPSYTDVIVGVKD